MKWTTPAEIKTQVQRLWDEGTLLASLADGECLFPRRLKFKTADSRELSEHFGEVRTWIAQLSESAGSYRIVWRSVNHRILGTNEIPAEIWIDSLDDALRLIGRRKAADRFRDLVEETRHSEPQLMAWLAKRPLRALDLADLWTQLLALVAWLRQHPRPALYLRQIDLPGIHTKLIEGHRGVLAELLDLILPAESIDRSCNGIGGFNQRYGFLDKPARVRFRILDPDIRLLPAPAAAQDITLTHADFAGVQLPLSKVFITENEINFLAFPAVPQALVIFGAGYGFEALAAAAWLQRERIYYWGDIDTHGFAILNQLRGVLPQTLSFLMDQPTLLHHRPLWGVEAEPQTAELQHLTAAENMLYRQLVSNHWSVRLRLEQERIGFGFLHSALQQLR